MFNIILDELPDYVKINEKEYPIETDFKNWLRFNRELDKPESQVTDECILKALSYVLKEVPDEPAALIIDALISFYRVQGDEPDQHDKPILMRDVMDVEKPKGPEVISYNHDADFIYSAFLQQYGIDLRLESLHWYTFISLFAGLTEESKIMKIMGYRSITDFGKMSKSEKEHYRSMQKAYALPDKRTAEEMESDFADGL